MDRLAAYEKQMLASPDQQISLTDPDSRSMATSGRGSGVNVQVAVDTEHHLIIAHEVQTPVRTGHNSPTSPLAQRLSSASKNSKPSLIGATTVARKSLPATRRELR